MARKITKVMYSRSRNNMRLPVNYRKHLVDKVTLCYLTKVPNAKETIM